MGVLVGKKAPEFSLKAVMKGRIENQYSLAALRGKYVVLFFYPLDFTFVCPTEFHAFQDRYTSLNTRVLKWLVALSIVVSSFCLV